MRRAAHGGSLESVIGMCTDAVCSPHTRVLISP